MNRWTLGTLAALIAAGLSDSPSFGHDFFVNPAKTGVEAGENFAFTVLTTPNFLVGDETEAVENVKVSWIEAGKPQAIKLKENRALMGLDGLVTARTSGIGILAAVRKPVIWTKIKEGWVQKSKKGLEDVVKSGRYEKYAKVLVTVDGPDNGFSRILGHRLEIIPLSDPTQAGEDVEIPVRVLFDGKPSAGEVFARERNFSGRESTYSFYTKTFDDNDIAYVRIDRPGLWIVKAQREVGAPTEDYDKEYISAYLIFSVP